MFWRIVFAGHPMSHIPGSVLMKERQEHFNSTMWNPEIQKSLNFSTFSEQNKIKYNRALGKVSWSALQMELVGRLGTGQLAAAGAARGGCSWFHFYPPCKVISSCLHPPAKQQAFHPLFSFFLRVCESTNEIAFTFMRCAVSPIFLCLHNFVCREYNGGKFVLRPREKVPHTHCQGRKPNFARET